MHFLPVKKGTGFPMLLFLLFTIVFNLKSMAGDRYVLYLKNGTILRCEHYRYISGTDYLVWINRDTLIKGENYYMQLSRDTQLNISEDQVFRAGIIHRHALTDYELDYKYDSSSKTYVEGPNHFIHERGFFFQWQLSVIMIDGMRLMMGYRFNTYIALGLGVGAEYGSTLHEYGYYGQGNLTTAPSYVYKSGYSPFYLYFTGDILKTKATPFYSLELGYNLPWYPHLQTNTQDGAIPPPYSYYANYGGPTAGLGFGCRVYSRKRSNISISANMNVGYLSIKTQGFEGFSNNNYPSAPIYIITTSKYILTQPSLRFGVGF